MKRILALVLALAVSSAFADHVRFIVTGDGRSETKAPRAGDKNGVNVEGLGILNRAIIAEKPNLLLFSGDLVGGTKTDADELIQFQTWMDAMKPVYDAGIKVLTVRGNHEIHCEHPADVWRQVFSGPFANPNNGPAGEEDMTFTYEAGDALIIGLDQFQGSDAHINQAWLDGVLAKNKKAHVFAFMHKMAFRSGRHDDGMETDPDARDKFVMSLVNGGSKAFFCGHDHLYDHLMLTKAGWPGSKYIHKYMACTAGAPFFNGTDRSGKNSDWVLNPMAHEENTLGYILVDVDGPVCTITSKAVNSLGESRVIDTFTYGGPATRS